MNKIYLINKLKTIIFMVELILALVILLGVLAGLASTILQIPGILTITRDHFYNSFREFLGNALLLVVGVELMRMLITHTTRATMELIVYVIARKLLIYTDSMTDIVLGTIALAVVFLTIRFLLPAAKSARKGGLRFPGSISLEELGKKLSLEIPANSGLNLSEFIQTIRKSAVPPVPGEKIEAGPINLTICKTDANGTIEEVEISESNFAEDDV